MSGIAKNAFVLVGLAIIGGLGYYLFVMNADSEFTGSTSLTVNEAQIASEQFLRQIQLLQNNTLPDDVFQDSRFQSLVDFTTPVPAQPTGRSNPFEPAQ